MPIAIGFTDPWRGAGYNLGYIVIAVGFVVLGSCIRDFYVSGKGTLAPWAPPEHLVIVGLYRYVRNPMYLGVLLIVSGLALIFASSLAAFYCVLLAMGFHLRVMFSEEIQLAEQFGEEWKQYEQHVPRWVPNATPFQNKNL